MLRIHRIVFVVLLFSLPVFAAGDHHQLINGHLLHAARIGDAGEVAEALDRGASPGARDVVNIPALYHAVGSGDFFAVQALLSAYADPNAIEYGAGNSVLHCAVMRGSQVIIQLLLASGADPRIQNDFGVAPAQMTSNEHIRQILIERAAELDGV